MLTSSCLMLAGPGWRRKVCGCGILPATVAIIFFSALGCLGVTSKITRHSTANEFLKGKAEGVIVGSRGTLQLARSYVKLAEGLEDVWALNCIAADASGAIYFGTSPNGDIFKYADEAVTKVYPVDVPAKQVESDPNEPGKAEPGQHLLNEHIFAMAIDGRGRLLAGVSGQRPHREEEAHDIYIKG